VAVNGCVALTATDADAGVTSMEVSEAVPDVPEPDPEPVQEATATPACPDRPAAAPVAGPASSASLA